VQDRIFAGGPFVDPDYQQRRRNIFILAVHCGHPAGTCFCASMGTGPAAAGGFDLALTELTDGGEHRFLVEVGSDEGGAVLSEVSTTAPDDADLAAAAAVIDSARGRMGRRLDTDGLPRLLQDNPLHPRWDDVAARCLSCANCTMVCPTCFCSTVEDVTDVSADHAERWRRWDSCFTTDFSYIHGGAVRASVKSRYRQWITHKLSTWHDQFGTSGCVGCGRCITWCPVAIDITEEAAFIRNHPYDAARPARLGGLE
jgi:sulfhydrogenase subunit beta (sulfur reductase)